MVVFHLARDLQMFGLAPPGMTQAGLWPVFARAVAGSFLFLSGVSLWLAHGAAMRWRPFAIRLARIAAAAGLVTLATWAAFPGSFVFFGILHCIAAASVIGLAFLRLPAAVTLLAALLALGFPAVLRGPAFDAPWLLWLGLATGVPPTFDYVPVLPWLAPFLAGLALAKIAARAGGLRPRGVPPSRLAMALGWPGRHSLAVYLLHQPVLLAAIWLVVTLRA
jgi:uncharacterized membrane protein